MLALMLAEGFLRCLSGDYFMALFMLAAATFWQSYTAEEEPE
jgi:hypothetical protein